MSNSSVLPSSTSLLTCLVLFCNLEREPGRLMPETEPEHLLHTEGHENEIAKDLEILAVNAPAEAIHELSKYSEYCIGKIFKSMSTLAKALILSTIRWQERIGDNTSVHILKCYKKIQHPPAPKVHSPKHRHSPAA